MSLGVILIGEGGRFFFFSGLAVLPPNSSNHSSYSDFSLGLGIPLVHSCVLFRDLEGRGGSLFSISMIFVVGGVRVPYSDCSIAINI